MRAHWLIPLLLVWALPARAQERCTARDVNRALLSDENQWPASCPRPAATELLGADTAAALRLTPSNAQRQTQLLAAVRALARAAQLERSWGPAFAERVEHLVTEFDPKRCDKPWELEFSAPRAPIAPIGACQCALEVGVEGGAGHACFRFPQPSGEALPACEQAGLVVYDLPDWASLARAHVIYDLAHAALVALSDNCRNLVVTRLGQAEQRWHRLVTGGQLQYPWELWFSRWLSDDYGNFSRCFASDPNCTGEEALDPETLRPIFLHPGVGLGFPGFGKHDGNVSAQARLVIELEAFGLNVYDAEFKQFLGASLGVAFQDADFARPRLAAFVHLSRYVQLGYLLGVTSATRAHGTLYVSVDLLGWANRALGLQVPIAAPK